METETLPTTVGAAARLYRPSLIGVAGHGGVGKSTLADGLADYGYQSVSFGSHIGALLADINPIVTVVDGQPRTWNDIQREHGYEGSKKIDGVLPLLIATGEHIKLRQSDFWVRQVLTDRHRDDLHILTGPRSVAELDAIRAADGVLIRVNRRGVGPRHEQETQIEGYRFDLDLDNDSTPEVLVASAAAALGL